MAAASLALTLPAATQRLPASRSAPCSLRPARSARTHLGLGVSCSAEPSSSPSEGFAPCSTSSQQPACDAGSQPRTLLAAVQRMRDPLQRLLIMRAALLQRLAAASSSLGLGSSSARQQLGALLAAAAIAGPVNGYWADLTSNYVFCVGFWGWFAAQFAKIFTKRYKTGVWDLKAFVDSGGMPSSHSSLCSSVTTAVALSQGLASPLFAVALCFTVIVMYDAMGVRRHAGLQAEVLNILKEQLIEKDHPVSERKLKEVLGHTPRQVLCGGVLGVIVGLLLPGPF